MTTASKPTRAKREKKQTPTDDLVSPPVDSSGRKRNRVPISCTICRRRKVKCDKRRPVCTACEKTGVAHLCHYIDPVWAQPLSSAEAGVSMEQTDSEVIEKLKEKIRHLESQLNAANGVISPSTISDTESRNGSVIPDNHRLHNENLNLSKKFDMLHIKSTSTVHLGATSWLAIMKGDPYLRVLWAHIFKLRKQAEEMKFKKRMEDHNGKTSHAVSSGDQIKLVRHLNSDIASPAPSVDTRSPSVGITCPVSGKDLSQGKCPVIHTSGKCPVDYNRDDEKRRQMDVQGSTPTPTLTTRLHESIGETCPVSGKLASSGVCPVAHEELEDELNSLKKMKSGSEKAKNNERSIGQDLAETDTEDDDDSAETDKLSNKVCPLMVGDNSFLDNLRKAKRKSENTEPQQKKRKKPSRSNSSGSSKGPKAAEEKVSPEDFKRQPVAMMQRFLPKKKALWLLIDRFFEVLYIYMPFVDEQSFREEARFIFGNPDDEDQKVTIKIRSGVDFALVGTVCIILRLAWNTLPKNNLHAILKKTSTIKSYNETTETIRFLERPENEVPLELVDCVKHCFSNLKLMRKSSLKIVQCALYMKLYFVYSPEDGDGADGSDSQIFLGMIIQMAISIGLHRDPKNFENFANERQRHLWRKIWFELLSLDIHQSMNLGCPRSLQEYESFSDTRLPGETEDGLDLEEFKGDIKELTVIKNLHTTYNIDKLIAKTMGVLLNVNEPATRTQVDALINELQKSINGFNTKSDQYAVSQLGKILVNRTKLEPLVASATRAIEFKLHVIVNMLIYLLNYILFVHFEPKGAQDAQASVIAKDYAQRALDCALDGYRNCSLFFDAGLEYFGPGVDLVLAPLLLLIGHRSIQFMVSLILRSRCGPFMRPHYVNDLEKTTVNPQSFSGSLDAKIGSINVDNRNHDLNDIEIKDTRDQYKSVFNIDVNSGEILATILLEHMDKFHTLADALGSKYPYSWRMSKAVGFFITLLKKPINVVKNLAKTENVQKVENNTGFISTVLNSVPLVLSTDEEKLRKCPVFSKGESVHVPAQYQQVQGQDGSQKGSRVSRSMSQSSFPDQSQEYRSPTYNDQSGNTASRYVPTPGQSSSFPNNFSLSFNDTIYETMSNNPINTVDVELNEQFPELLQGSESFSNFNDNGKSFGDIFGIINDAIGITGDPTSFEAQMREASTMGSPNNREGMGISGAEFNTLMTGNWFG